MAELSAEIYGTVSGPIQAAVIDPIAGRSEVALLAIHGTPGDYRQLRGFATDFAGRVTVVLPTRPAYGETPLSTGPTPVDQADAYCALLDELGIETVVVVGVSGGAPSAYSMAAHHPQRCAGLVLVCGAAGALIEVPLMMRILIKVPGLWSLLSKLERRRSTKRLANPAAAESALRADLLPVELARLDLDPRLRADLSQFGRDRIDALSGAGLRNDFRRALSRRGAALGVVDGAAVPTLIVHGSLDPVVALTHGEYHRDLIAGSELVVLEGFGHALPATARVEVNAVITRALDTAGA